MQPGAGAQRSTEQVRRGSVCNEAAENSEVEAQSDLLGLVSIEFD